MTRRTRVRFGPRDVNVTAPSTCPFAPVDFQTMCESATCSTVVACHSRCDQKTWAFQVLFSSSISTFSTFFMKLGKSSYCVQRLYVALNGRPMSSDSEMTVTLSFLPLPPPPPPPPPKSPATLSFRLLNIPPMPERRS